MRAQACPRESVEDARVIISELVGNSVRHALPLPDGTIVLTWGRFGPGIRISVTDGGSPSHPHKMNASTSAVSGRGIAIVETLALDWWTEQSRARSTIYTVLRPVISWRTPSPS